MTKPWASKMGPWDEASGFYGEEYVFLRRLWLAGCKFACVDRALNYRRYHVGRVYDAAASCASELAAQEKVFADPRVPEDVRRLRDLALANTSAVWAYRALAQNETALGQHLLRETVRLNPSTLQERGRKLLELMIHGTGNERVDHEALLGSIFAQLPPDLAWRSARFRWAIANGCFWRGTRAVIWGDAEEGRQHFARAAALGAEIDDPCLQGLTYELLHYETGYGAGAAHTVRRTLMPFIKQVGGAAAARAFIGCYAINRAFASYRDQRYPEVPARLLRAMVNDPRYLLNRGALSMLVRSLTSRGRAPKNKAPAAGCGR